MVSFARVMGSIAPGASSLVRNPAAFQPPDLPTLTLNSHNNSHFHHNFSATRRRSRVARSRTVFYLLTSIGPTSMAHAGHLRGGAMRYLLSAVLVTLLVTGCSGGNDPRARLQASAKAMGAGSLN